MKRSQSLLRLGLAALTAAVAACDQSVAPTPGRPPETTDPRFVRAGDDAIPGRYVVVLKRERVTSAASVAREVIGVHGGKLHFTYENAISGFAATLSAEAVEELVGSPHVEYVAQDAMVEPTATQTPATWGLDRIDQRALPLNNVYNYTPTGAGVTAYIIDTGIRTTHTEFGGRASVGTDLVGDGQNGQDCNGHGTHVAGTVGGSTWGVAKAVGLVAVRVFGCTGGAPFSTVIAAVDWVTANAVDPAVVNMSLGGGGYQPLDDAINASIASGIVYAVAAGNEDQNACNVSPARNPNVITVASSTSADARSSFSNWGSCVDLFAPGSGVTSAWYTGDSSTAVLSGTSMASPHAAGVAALYRQLNPSHTPAQVNSALVFSASSGRISDPVGSPNLLLYSLLTPEALRLNVSTLVFNVTGEPTAAESGSRERITWHSSGDASGKPSMDAGAGGTSPTAVDTASVTLTNTTGSAVSWTRTSSQAWLTTAPASGSLAGGASAPIAVIVNTAGLSSGTYSGTITFNGGGASISLNVTLVYTPTTTLVSGVPVTGLSGTTGDQKHYRIAVPAGADSLVVTLAGPNGDADLYVRQGVPPTTGVYDCRGYTGSSYEYCKTTAPPADVYYVMVRAYSTYSGVTLLATVHGDFGPPNAPSGVAANGAGAGRVNVTWADNSGNEDFFRVRRSLRAGDGTFGPYSTVGNRGPNNTSLLDSTVVIGNTYRYQLQACNENGCTYSAPSSAITVVQPPLAPSGLTALIGGVRTVALNWNDNSSNEVNFRVRRATRNPDGTFTAYSTLRLVGANSTGDTDTTVVPGTTYRYQVQACNGGGCATSNAVAITIPLPPGAPYGLAASVVSPTQINLAWSDGAANETSFRLRRSKRNPDGTFGSYVLIATLGSNATSYFDMTATPSSTYRYYVQACNGGGCTSSGVTPTVTTPGS